MCITGVRCLSGRAPFGGTPVIAALGHLTCGYGGVTLLMLHSENGIGNV